MEQLSSTEAAPTSGRRAGYLHVPATAVRQGAVVLKNVAVIALDGVEPFDLGVLYEVFGVDRTGDGLPGYEFAVMQSNQGYRPTLGFT